MTRKPNTNCYVCQKAIYRRPFEIESYDRLYCSRICMFADRKVVLSCELCGQSFQRVHNKRFCSKSCAGKVTRNRTGTKKGFRTHKSSTDCYLTKLKQNFEFSS